MNAIQAQHPENEGAFEYKPYSQWGDSRADAHHAARTANHQAAFFTPYLQTGMRLLDCGCGPGTITVGLAQMVAPGEVVGIDLDEAALQSARQLAKEQQSTNIRFEIGDVYSLPFPDSYFDAVFSHALLEHLEHPLKMLREAHRVTRTGGIVGIRLPDLDGWLLAPPNPLIEQWISVVDKFRSRHGADMRRGKYLRDLLHETDFAEIVIGASYDSHGTPESTQAFVNRWFPQEYDPAQEPMVKVALMDQDTMAKMVSAWRNWATDPGAFLARSFCEAVGRKV